MKSWKIEMVRHYFKNGWTELEIMRLHHITSEQFWQCIEGNAMYELYRPLGNKDTAYYMDEMDYANLGPAPIPQHVIL